MLNRLFPRCRQPEQQRIFIGEMISYRALLFLLLLPGWLIACKPVDVDLLAEQIEAEVGVRAQVPTSSVTPNAEPAEGVFEGSPTATTGPDGTRSLSDEPSITPDLIEMIEDSTLSMTNTLAITPTEMISPTIVITTTQVITSTWDYREMPVTDSGVVSQVAWVEEDHFAVGTSTGLYLYQLDDLALVRSSSLGEAVRSVTYSPGEGLLVWGDFKGDIHWYEPESGQYLATTGGHRMGITDLTQPRGSLYLVSGSDDGTVRTWVPTFVINQAANTAAWMDLWQAPDRIACVASDPTQSLVAAGSYQSISVWNLDTRELVWQVAAQSGWVNDLGFSPDGRMLAAADASGHLKIWSTDGWVLTHDISIEACDQITALDFSSTGAELSFGCKNGAVWIWNTIQNTLGDPGVVYPATVIDLAYHPHEPILLAGYQDGVLRVGPISP